MARRVNPVSALPTRPTAPPGLPAEAKKVWESIVIDYPPKHFRGANLPILEQFCRAHALAAECDRAIESAGLLVDGKPNPTIYIRTQAWREMRSASTKLRLTISSLQRADSAKARPNAANHLSKP